MEICREALERRQEGKAGMGAGHKDHGRTILGMPLGLYLGVLALTSVCMYMGCVPKSLVPAFLVLMVFGEGLNAIGNTVPVVKTYLGGSVICILGAAAIQAVGLLPEQTYETMDFFINDSGFLIFYISALITGSLFNIDRKLLLRATVRLLPVAAASLAVGILASGLFGILLGQGFWGGILYLGVPMTSGGHDRGHRSPFRYICPGPGSRPLGHADENGLRPQSLETVWPLFSAACSIILERGGRSLRETGSWSTMAGR